LLPLLSPLAAPSSWNAKRAEAHDAAMKVITDEERMVEEFLAKKSKEVEMQMQRTMQR
jgi:hypothetical protein